MSDIELVTKALSDFDAVAAGLAQLEKTHKGVLFDVETHGGMELAKAARAILRKPRYEIERIRKEAKAPLLAIGKKLDAEAARITSVILALEEPIDQQIKSEEERKEREKSEKLAAEQKRKDDIQARIEAIRNLPVQAHGKTSAQIGALYDSAASMVIDDSFQEFADSAHTALASSVAALNGLRTLAAEQEAQQAKILADRAELEQLRAKQAEQDRIERERAAEEERKARVLREAEAAKQAEELKTQREQQEAEAARLAAARAEFEREQAEARRKSEEAEQQRLAAEETERKRKEAATLAAKKAKYPGDQAILEVLAKHFEVSEQVVRGWLTQLKAVA